MGTGKTLMSIAIVRYLQLAPDGVSRVLVLVPNNINRYEWRREIKKHSPETTNIVLVGSTAEKWAMLRSTKAFIVIATYAGLIHMVCKLVTVKKKGTKDTYINKMKIVGRLMNEISRTFDAIVMDESTSVANPKKLPFRICRQITNHTKAAFALSGTPFGRDPTPLWAQMFLIDRGDSLGKNLGIFRAAFFKEKENFWSGWPTYVFDPKKKELLHRFLAHRSLRYEADKADLPRVVAIVKGVSLPMDAQGYYEQASKNLVAAKSILERKNIFLRMRQISSGFLGYKDDDTGSKAEYEFPQKPKLDLLLSLIESAQESHKIVVMHDFVFSGSMICRELDRLKIGYARVYGKTANKAPEQLERFDSDPKCRVFIVNAAGAFGLNLQVAQYCIFYESPPSPILRKQMERRVERQESSHQKIFRYDLIVDGTVDARIREFHEEGKNLFEAIVNGRESL